MLPCFFYFYFFLQPSLRAILKLILPSRQTSSGNPLKRISWLLMWHVGYNFQIFLAVCLSSGGGGLVLLACTLPVIIASFIRRLDRIYFHRHTSQVAEINAILRTWIIGIRSTHLRYWRAVCNLSLKTNELCKVTKKQFYCVTHNQTVYLPAFIQAMGKHYN